MVGLRPLQTLLTIVDCKDIATVSRQHLLTITDMFVFVHSGIMVGAMAMAFLSGRCHGKNYWVYRTHFDLKKIHNFLNFYKKNLAYGRHWIYRPMRIVSPLQWREKKELMGGFIKKKKKRETKWGKKIEGSTHFLFVRVFLDYLFIVFFWRVNIIGQNFVFQ